VSDSKNESVSSPQGGETALSLLDKIKAASKDPYFWTNWIVVIAFVLVVAIFGAIKPHAYNTL